MTIPTGPDLDQFAEVVAQVVAMDLRTVEFDYLRRLIRESFIGTRARGLWCKVGQVIYRGVQAGGRPQTLSHLSYPPLELATTWGRVTRPGHRVFYASVARDSIPFELGLSPGDHVAVGRWRARDELMFLQIGFNGEALLALGGTRPVPEWMTAGDDEFSALDKQVHAFLSDHFCRRVLPGSEHLYKVSAAIADALLRNDFTFGDVPGYAGAPRVSGLLYPAIAMDGTADNIALLPAAVDDALELDWVEWMQVEAVDPNACRWVPLDFANSFGPGVSGRPSHLG